MGERVNITVKEVQENREKKGKRKAGSGGMRNAGRKKRRLRNY